ncbi:hypothetical protein [Sulfitobacter sp. 915]|uniref:hypothetical protein n=1 Tax=Sulfitobacter sp. 915 TaxID=3368558 RepID=UPI0037461395
MDYDQGLGVVAAVRPAGGPQRFRFLNLTNMTTLFLSTLEQSILTKKPDTPRRPMTYEGLNAKLNAAYEIMQALPELADRALDARVQHVANLLDGLTLDTFDDTLDADGISPEQVVEVAA